MSASSAPDQGRPIPRVAEEVARRLCEVEGVVAVVLGGSWGRGVARPDSDIDLGLYYHGDRPPRVDALQAFAAEIDDRRTPGLMTLFGEWGPWVNGGGWLVVEGQHVDVLYRDLERVAAVVSECREGKVTCDYYLGHPHGFHNHIYMGEVATCRPLFDPGHAITAMKLLTNSYPPAMRREIARKYLYDARFTSDNARKSCARGDVFHVAGSFFRVIAALVQVLYALNERYFLNEKGAVADVAGFPVRPVGFEATVQTVLANPGPSPEGLAESLVRLDGLTRQVESECRWAGIA